MEPIGTATKQMDAVNTSCGIAFEEAATLQDQDRLEECIEKAEALLADDGIPRYFRIKTMLLLASTVGDWLEVYQHWENAESLWRVVRVWHPVGALPRSRSSDGRLECGD